MGDRGTKRAPDDRLRWARTATGVVAVALLVTAAVTGALLSWRYRPDLTAAWANYPAPRWSVRLVRRHQVSLGLALPVVAVWGGLMIRDAYARKTGRVTVVAGASIAAVLLTAVTSYSWFLVKWDQLALWAVTVGSTEYDGLWYAAFSDEVRFVLVGGVEVSQATIAPWVVIHLVAPVLALVAGVIAWRETLHGQPTPASNPAPTST